MVRLLSSTCQYTVLPYARPKPQHVADKRHVVTSADVVFTSDQQLGQLYELMNTIREQELQGNDPDYEGRKE